MNKTGYSISLCKYRQCNIDKKHINKIKVIIRCQGRESRLETVFALLVLMAVVLVSFLIITVSVLILRPYCLGLVSRDILVLCLETPDD